MEQEEKPMTQLWYDRILVFEPEVKPEVRPEVDLEGANKLWAYKKMASNEEDL